MSGLNEWTEFVIEAIATFDCEEYGFWKQRFDDPELQKIYDDAFSKAYQQEQMNDANN